MEPHHHHEHSHRLTSLNKAFIIGIALNITFVIVEFGVGFYYNSLGLLSDAGHNLGDVASLALDGITSFSVKPIYGIVYLGGIFVFISILIGIYVLYALISGTAEHGWASLMLSIWFVGGVVLLSIGAVGLYIGKIYKEVKRRPLYNVEEVLYDDQNK